MKAIRVVAAAVVRDGKVLAARRGPTQRQAGLWELPGGKVEAGEEDGAALARELREELDVEVEVHEGLGESVHTYAFGTVRLVAYRCSLRAGEPRPHEHDALRWLGPDELQAVGWAPADLPLLDGVRRALRS